MKKFISVCLLVCLGIMPVLSNAAVTIDDVNVLLDKYYKGNPEDIADARLAIQNQTVAVLNNKISFSSAVLELCDVLGIYDSDEPECVSFSSDFQELMQISDEIVLANNEDLLRAELKNTLESQKFSDCGSVLQTSMEIQEQYSEITEAPSLHSCDCDTDFDTGTFTFECANKNGRTDFHVEGTLDR